MDTKNNKMSPQERREASRDIRILAAPNCL